MTNITDTRFVNLEDDDLVNLAKSYADAATDANVSRARVFAEILARGIADESDMSPKQFWNDARSDKYGDSHPFLGKSLTELVTLTPKLSLNDHVTVSGASRATVARARKAAGIADATRSEAISQGLEDAGITGNSDNSAQTAAHPFDLAKTLDKMDNTEIVAELVKLGPARAAQLATMLDKALASKSLAAV